MSIYYLVQSIYLSLLSIQHLLCLTLLHIQVTQLLLQFSLCSIVLILHRQYILIYRDLVLQKIIQLIHSFSLQYLLILQQLQLILQIFYLLLKSLTNLTHTFMYSSSRTFWFGFVFKLWTVCSKLLLPVFPRSWPYNFLIDLLGSEDLLDIIDLPANPSPKGLPTILLTATDLLAKLEPCWYIELLPLLIISYMLNKYEMFICTNQYL